MTHDISNYCKTCNRKPGLHPTVCFERYHTVVDFRAGQNHSDWHVACWTWTFRQSQTPVDTAALHYWDKVWYLTLLDIYSSKTVLCAVIREYAVEINGFLWGDTAFLLDRKRLKALPRHCLATSSLTVDTCYENSCWDQSSTHSCHVCKKAFTQSQILKNTCQSTAMPIVWRSI